MKEKILIFGKRGTGHKVAVTGNSRVARGGAAFSTKLEKAFGGEWVYVTQLEDGEFLSFWDDKTHWKDGVAQIDEL